MLKNSFDYKDRFDLDLAAGATDRPSPFADTNSDEAMKRLEAKYLADIEGGDQIDQPGNGDQGEKVDTDHQ